MVLKQFDILNLIRLHGSSFLQTSSQVLTLGSCRNNRAQKWTFKSNVLHTSSGHFVWSLLIVETADCRSWMTFPKSKIMFLLYMFVSSCDHRFKCLLHKIVFQISLNVNCKRKKKKTIFKANPAETSGTSS